MFSSGSLFFDEAYAITWMKIAKVGGGECWTPGDKDLKSFSDNRIICSPDECPEGEDKKNLPPICGGVDEFPSNPPYPPIRNDLLSNPDCKDKEKKSLFPVIFIPGIAGTQMKAITKDANGNDVILEVWPSAGWPLPYYGKDKLPPLVGMELEKDGRPPINSVEYKLDVIRKVAIFDVYEGMIQYLQLLGYTEGKDLFTFPYDWRLDNSQHFSQLDTWIKKAIENSKKDDKCKKEGQSEDKEDKEHDTVILIAHSMGGLLARGYILSDIEMSDSIKALITLSTPYWGAVKAYYALVEGYDFDNPFANKKMLKLVGQNAPAPYQLLPRIPFITDVDSKTDLSISDSYRLVKYKGVVSDNGRYVTLKDSTKNEWSMNPTVLDIADQYYLKLGTPDHPASYRSNVDEYLIAGVGVCTLGGYMMTSYDDSKIYRDPQVRPGKLGPPFKEVRTPFGIYGVEFNGQPVILSPIFMDGDGTVPIWSLKLHDTASDKTWFVKHSSGNSAEHGSVPGNKQVQEIVGDILNALNNDLPRPIVSQPYDPKYYKPMQPILTYPFGPPTVPSQCAK